MKITKIYLSYLAKDEGQKMTEVMSFLYLGGKVGKQELIDVSEEVYGADTRIELQWDNGHYPQEYHAKYGQTEYITVIQFKPKDLTPDAINLLGGTDSLDFPYYYAIMLCRDDRQLYVVSYKDCCRPNWNEEYQVQRMKKLNEVDIPFLKEGRTIYRMEDALHSEINRRLSNCRPLFEETDGRVQMTVNDQHGNYTKIIGNTVEDVFRNYADNYTGYRNFRRQMDSEWEISEPDVRARYEQWKKTANGLKSSFDKFYGGGIVD